MFLALFVESEKSNLVLKLRSARKNGLTIIVHLQRIDASQQPSEKTRRAETVTSR